MRTSLPARAAAAVAAAGLLAVPATTPAFAADGDYTLPLHQQLPVTATSPGVSHESSCPGVGPGQDGWHFVLPGNSTSFVKLTVTFQPGGQQVVTSFDGPHAKMADVASAPGATLTSASAEVTGGSLDWFNLSHTCPAGTTPSTPPSQGTPSEGTGSHAPSTPPTGSPSGGSSTAPAGSPSAGQPSSPATHPSTGSSVSPSVSASASPSASTVAAPSASGSAAPHSSGSLASTGADIGVALLAGLLLLGTGTVLVMRRRKAGQH